MKHKVVSEEEMRIAIRAVFDRCREEHPVRIFSALVAITPKPWSDDNPQIHSMPPEFFDREMDEVCWFSSQMDEFIELVPKQADWSESYRARYTTTLKTMVYCHITEADLPYLILLNLLRVLSGLDCCFTFYKRNPDDTVKVNDDEQQQQCRFPRHKIKEIKRQDSELKTGVGEALQGLLYPKYRDAFAHSQYTIDSDGTLTCTGSLTGMSHKTFLASVTAMDILSPDEIGDFYRAATAYLATFLECYKAAIEPFRDGKFHKHGLNGQPIRWDEKRQQWTWQNPPE